MLFPSLAFLCIFLQSFLIAYLLLPKHRTITLIIFSLIFYAFGEPVWVIVLLLSGIVNYYLGRAIERIRETGTRRAVFVTSIIFNLALLCVFKYAGFIVENINLLFNCHIPVPAVSLPIGISFYTFQAMSYVTDLYWGKIKAPRSLMIFLSYITMFPQLIAGPIVRYSDIQDQLASPAVNMRNFSAGITRFVTGLGKKVLLADYAGSVVNNLFNVDANFTVLGCWVGLFFFALQIYFDFSGYSDMAIGLGLIIGVKFQENFNYPFISRSVTEFWRRWHVSLSSFFREYVYLPLGGSRRHQIINIVIVWGLTGLWHGANWNYMFWGLYYGLLIILERKLLFRILDKLPVFGGHIYTLAVLTFGWPLFYFTSNARLFEFFKAAFGVGVELYDIRIVSVLGMNAILIPVLILGCTPLPKRAAQLIKARDTTGLFEPIGSAVLLIICFIVIIGQSYSPFLYFRF